LPPGTTPQVPNQIIASSVWNAALDDIAASLNVAWPVAIGIGAAGATGSWDSINIAGTDIASAGTINLTTATGPNLTITGTTTVTTVTLASGNVRFARADAAFQLTASANLIINGSASTNYTTTAGDLLIFIGASGSITRVWTLGSTSSASIPSNSLSNFGLVASVAANALTIAVKGIDGNDPSSSNPVAVPFRSATAGSGDVDVLTLTAATSIVISSGSTLGAPTGSVPFRVWIVGFNDGGTFRLGAILCTTLASGVLTQFPLSAWGIASSTAEGGAGAADSAQTFYTGTAVASKAYTVLGYLSFETGIATAGTWDAAPTRVQVFGPGVALPGAATGNRKHVNTVAMSTFSTIIPYDDTIPQNTEGTQLFSQSMTPTSAANILRVRWQLNWAGSVALYAYVALFRDATADALVSWQEIISNTNYLALSYGTFDLIASSTSSTDMKLRAGPDRAATMTLNGTNGARVHGGVMQSHFEVEEISA
jgi:hypothetical protein